ncbi:3-dehydroquinate dehydratase [Corynebacterium ulcerans]|uniref:3-dehydroquinate dehydratase n=1 Tax=Corynebacterium ramonii TaxID=3026968 RepID=A0ABM5RRZ9_9CORY|nr:MULTISPECIES: type II 3-dehydroquinate dehydratase [Corynebacterium]AIU32798.1 3-dehydroquinate dehydratase (3-dehydroquinase)(Type II DHQase) [Corynebacterium ramonii FRC0011]AKA96765.1 3-dehydroquinate dehydratase [Corynebacterium ulcerans]ESU57631.1 3-dehydroquinate dehydratase [Corynebacterium ulcerans NCTC 12077]KKO85053.1 3-dehydroquinate dehydratase [Corynebacterium ulcerans]KKO85666.1 3-dehydroquinate dehydratase [Corynebacterium ulcerans]
MNILVLNGPNLDRLGKRQPEVYGRTTLADVEKSLVERAAALGVTVAVKQSNHEGELIEWVHEAADAGWPVIINPGGLTHTSVALRDALAEVHEGAGFVEVHISNIHAREEFRHHSFLSPIARGVIAGLGVMGYELALEYLVANSHS